MPATPRTRDAGIGRIARVTRWALAAAVGGAAIVSFVAAKAQTGSTPTGAATRIAPAPSEGPAKGDPGPAGLQPSLTPPRSAGGGGLVNSGGS